MSNVNKHDLKRTIPEPVKRKIRKNAGFGCVICGNAICEYEHVDPEWAEAKSHNPNKMTLLCSQCHSKKTRGIYSVQKVKEAMNSPYCKKAGFSSDALDFGMSEPIIQLGKTHFHNPLSLIMINNESVFSILPPDPKIKDSPYNLNALFKDNESNELVEIKDNIWYGNSSNWDIETKGTKIIVRKKLGEIVLMIENLPRERFIVHKINMNYKGYLIKGDTEGIHIKTPNGKEIFTLGGDARIWGKVALNIQVNKVIFYKLKVKNAKVNWIGGGVLSHCIIENSEIKMS